MIMIANKQLDDSCLYVADGDADVEIARLSKFKRCPVLSNDADFYVYPLFRFIPYSKFEWYNAHSDKAGLFLEMYSYEDFIKEFSIAHPSLLVLALSCYHG